jgi:hypothetical protein
MWNPGRTIAASNRVQLAVTLTRLWHEVNVSAARALVTDYLRSRFTGKNGMGMGDTWAALETFMARDGLCSQCSPNASWARGSGQSVPRSRFAGSGDLDAYNLPLMQQLGFDSAQLLFQVPLAHMLARPRARTHARFCVAPAGGQRLHAHGARRALGREERLAFGAARARPWADYGQPAVQRRALRAARVVCPLHGVRGLRQRVHTVRSSERNANQGWRCAAGLASSPNVRTYRKRR